MKITRMIVVAAVAFLGALVAYAQTKGYYGVVQSYGKGSIVIGMANSTGHWTVDSNTQITGAIAVADWVYVDVATSGHVNVLRFQERPAGRSGVVKEVRGIVLVVRSGNGEETWNVTPETIVTGIERGQFQPGDSITAKLYKNQNLAEVVLKERGVATDSAPASGNADDTAQAKVYHGVVQSYGNGSIVVSVPPNLTGHWTVDSSTQITGAIAPADWVYVDVATSGHVNVLKFEERPAGRAGVVKEVRGNVLVVPSGNGDETWNVTPETILRGIESVKFQSGDMINGLLYKNNNLAEVVLRPATVEIFNATSYPILLVAATNQPGVDLLRGTVSLPGKRTFIAVTPGIFELRASIFKLPSTVQIVARSSTFGSGHAYLWTIKEKSKTVSGVSYNYLDSYYYTER